MFQESALTHTRHGIGSSKAIFRSAYWLSPLSLVVLLSFTSEPAYAENDKTQTAIAFLKEACVASGRRLEVKASGNGSFKLKKLWDTGGGAEVTVNKVDQSGFVSGVNAEGQASEMRACMQPYMKQIIDAILNSPSTNENATWVFIQRIEQSLTTNNHNCEHNCRNEPTRTGYSISLSAPSAPDNHPRLLRNPQLRCATGPCVFSKITVNPSVMPDGTQARASFDVWSLPTTWVLAADYYEFK